MRFFACFLLLLCSHFSSAVSLERTALGKAVLRENFPAFKREVEKLSDRHEQYALNVLRARDIEGSHLFHLLAKVKGPHQESFSAQILYLGYVLIFLDGFKGLEFALSPNKRGLSPIEAAERADNKTAIEYLTIIRNIELNFEKQSGFFQEIAPMVGKEMEKEEIKKLSLGGLVGVNGLIFSFLGVETNAILPFLLGVPQLAIGGMACYEAFKSFQTIRKNTQKIERKNKNTD